jgi:hypothetical protein
MPEIDNALYHIEISAVLSKPHPVQQDSQEQHILGYIQLTIISAVFIAAALGCSRAPWTLSLSSLHVDSCGWVSLLVVRPTRSTCSTGEEAIHIASSGRHVQQISLGAYESSRQYVHDLAGCSCRMPAACPALLYVLHAGVWHRLWSSSSCANGLNLRSWRRRTGS